MASTIRLIIMSAVLCKMVGCGQINEPQVFTAQSNQAHRDDREAQGDVSVQAEASDQSSSNFGSGTALAIFEKRILPIFQSVNPSSCVECHLSGVDLKEYIRPTQQQTFASLVSAGLIDMANPDDSKILQFISRQPKQPTLVTENVRRKEYEAFRDWVHAAVIDSTLIADKDAQPIGSQLPVEVIRHARNDRVLASFVENVWTEVGRCAACHSPDRNQKQVSEHGEQVSWIKLGDPEATLKYMLEAELIDAKNPANSLLLLKPMMQVKHGGGLKMVIGDRTYKQFRRFIDDYVAVVQSKYTKIELLPEPNPEASIVTDIWLKVEGIPAKFDKMLMQVDVYQMTDSGWSENRMATSHRPMFGGGNLWQYSLSLTANKNSDWEKQIPSLKLPHGKYLVKLFVDQAGKLQKDFAAKLSDEDFIGQIEVESEWPSGYGNMTKVTFPAQ